jgi:hypothetical protein
MHNARNGAVLSGNPQDVQRVKRPEKQQFLGPRTFPARSLHAGAALKTTLKILEPPCETAKIALPRR